MSNNLAVREFLVELFPGFTANIRPWEVGDKIFAKVDIRTPLGPVSLLISMETHVFESMLNAARASGTHLKLWAFFKDQLGWIPKVYSVNDRGVVPR
jgi:hypothetical protein